MNTQSPVFWALSLLLHAALLLVLWTQAPTPPRAMQAREQAREQALIQASSEQAQRMQMQRQVQALEKLQRQLQGQPLSKAENSTTPPPGNDPQALLQRAKAAQAAIAQTLEKSLAQELARLLNMPPEKALARLREQALPTSSATSPGATANATPAQAAAQIADLSARAQQAAQAQHDLTQRQAQGTAVGVQAAGAADGDGGGGGGVGGSAGTAATGPSGFFNDPRNYSPRAKVDVAATTATRFAPGRSLGPGGVQADRVYINVWYLAGPFAGRGPASQAYAYPPEQGVNLDAVYAGAEGRSLRWRYVNDASYPSVPTPHSENAVFYAYTEVHVDQAQDLWLDLGADDDAKLWLNDELVWTSDNGDKPWYHSAFTSLRQEVARYGLVETSRRVHLQAGRNTLLLKLYNGCCQMFYSVVLRP